MNKTKKVDKNKENKAVIWDLDGVLADTVDIHFQAWKEAVWEEYRIEITREIFNKYFGRGNSETLKKLIGKEPPDNEVKSVVNIKEECFRRKIKKRKHFPSMPGVCVLLNKLTKYNWIFTIASSAPQKNIDLLLKKMDIQCFFKNIVASENIKKRCGKPSPDIFIMAAEKIGLNDKHNHCVVVEDSPVGIQAADRAGMPCIALATTRPMSELETFINKEIKNKEKVRLFKDLNQVKMRDFLRLINT